MPASGPSVATTPARELVATERRRRRNRAWLLTGALGAATFAWSFGYILGEVRAGSDPGLRRVAAPAALTERSQTPVTPQTQIPQPLAPQQQQTPQSPSQQALPPVTTQQS